MSVVTILFLIVSYLFPSRLLPSVFSFDVAYMMEIFSWYRGLPFFSAVRHVSALHYPLCLSLSNISLLKLASIPYCLSSLHLVGWCLSLFLSDGGQQISCKVSLCPEPGAYWRMSKGRLRDKTQEWCLCFLVMPDLLQRLWVAQRHSLHQISLTEVILTPPGVLASLCEYTHGAVLPIFGCMFHSRLMLLL